MLLSKREWWNLADTPDLGSGAARLEGSNPFSRIGRGRAGIAQLVELHLAKVDVAGSSPVSRSCKGDQDRLRVAFF